MLREAGLGIRGLRIAELNDPDRWIIGPDSYNHELIDTEVYARWQRRFGETVQWGRVLSSNVVAVPVDSAIFVAVAFLGVLPGAVLMDIFVVNVVVKGLVTLLSIPLIYTVRPSRVVRGDDWNPLEPASS